MREGDDDEDMNEIRKNDTNTRMTDCAFHIATAQIASLD